MKSYVRGVIFTHLSAVYMSHLQCHPQFCEPGFKFQLLIEMQLLQSFALKTTPKPIGQASYATDHFEYSLIKQALGFSLVKSFKIDTYGVLRSS